jgi:death-on-curing family protein
MPRATTLRELAEEAGLELDEALVAAWSNGHDFLEDVNDRVPASAVGAVRKSLGLNSPKEMQHLSFWEIEWDLDRNGVVERLASDFGVQVSPTARTLPKGALRRLRSVNPALRAAGPYSQVAVITPAGEVFEWMPPGHCRDVAPLSPEEVCQIHEALIQDFVASGDPIEPPGVRDENLLHSAVSRPETAMGEVKKYSTVEVYAAALLHSLVHNHPFHNGNKRTAVVSMLVFLDRNNVLLTCSEQALFKHVLLVAQHGLVPYGASQRADREVIVIAEWICANSRPIQRGERNLRWRELRKILGQQGCTIGSPLPGNKIKIERAVATSGRLRILAARKLKVTAGYRNDGSEVDVNQINYIRRELHLDEAHGYDGEYFYGKGRQHPDAFIAQYRTLLKRLARL